MQTLLLHIEKIRIKKSQKFESNHFWYNPKTKLMETYCCGKLSFVFDMHSKCLKPQPEDVYINIYEEANNKKEIEKWIQSHKNYVSINEDYSSLNQIAIDIDDKDIDFIQQSLEFAGIRCD